MSGEKAAVSTALEAVGNELPGSDEEQLDLIGAPQTAAVIELRTKRNGPGRPPNARNKRTIEWANYLLSRYASPLEVLAQIATARVDELTASIGCTKLEALQEKRLAALALLPYVHQKQPVAIDVTNRDVIHLTIIDGGDAGDDGSLTAQIIEHIPREANT